jgi:hypothetical protein
MDLEASLPHIPGPSAAITMEASRVGFPPVVGQASVAALMDAAADDSFFSRKSTTTYQENGHAQSEPKIRKS